MKANEKKASIAETTCKWEEDNFLTEAVVEVAVARDAAPGFRMLGVSERDSADMEARLRLAVEATDGICWPAGLITVNVMPYPRRRVSNYDLPVLLAILSASGQVDPKEVKACECHGIVSLDGTVRSFGPGAWRIYGRDVAAILRNGHFSWRPDRDADAELKRFAMCAEGMPAIPVELDVTVKYVRKGKARSATVKVDGGWDAVPRAYEAFAKAAGRKACGSVYSVEWSETR